MDNQEVWVEKVQKLPSGRWRARIFKDGRKLSLGSYATKKEAEQAQAEALLDRGEVQRGQVKFWKYAETHLMIRKDDLAKGSWDNYLRSYRTHLEPVFGQTKLADLSAARVKRWWVSMRDTPGPRRAAYMVLSNIMRAAERDGEIQRNPCNVPGASRDVSTVRPAASLADVQLLSALASDEQTRVIMTVLVSSGLRIGELLALDWQDFDAERGTLHIYKHITRYGIEKGRKKHPDADVLQPITPSAVEALSALRASASATDPMFTNSASQRLSYDAWRARWSALTSAYGLEGIRTHDIRATHLTAFAEHATLKETMERGGHGDVRSAMRYQRPDPERQAQIVAQLRL